MTPTHKPMTRALTRRRDDERGVVLVLVAFMMTVFMGMAAIAIDIGYFDQQHTQAQSAADAAALAGAAVLATSQSAATTNAENYVVTNAPNVPHVYTVAPTVCSTSFKAGVCIQFPTSSTGLPEVRVTVSQTVPSFFGHLLTVSVASANVGASATAAVTPGGPAICSTPGSTCYALFAKDSNCTAGHYGLQFTNGSTTITGGILSNGNIWADVGGSNYGATIIGPASPTPACAWTSEGGGGTWASGPTNESSIIASYPIDYTTDFPSCTGAACTGPSGTPSFCTVANTSTSWSLSSVAAGNIYCGVGTGTPGTPSTWNDAITVGAGGVGSSSVPLSATYVGGSVSLGGGGDYLSSCGYAVTGYKSSLCGGATPALTTPNYPLVYATGTSATAIGGGGGGSYFYGDLFAPFGTINFNGGGNATSFLEADDIVYTGGGLIGDGPSTSGSISGPPGSVALIQ